MSNKRTVHDAAPAEVAGQRLILAVDDDIDHLSLIERWLQLAGYRVTTAPTGQDALARLEEERPDLVLSDLFMDEMDGLRLLTEIHAQDPVLPFVIVSGKAAIPDALKAAHLGVSAFLIKPIQRQDLINAVAQVLDGAPGRQPPSATGFASKIVHRSQAMREALKRAQRVALSDSTVMIRGETGSGKELLAQAIHEASARREAAFVSLNCSALPEQLLESELFGHEKGAFTGALKQHTGLFQTADRGTLFLDEIGDMPLTLQSKLLRVLQDFHVRPVGSTNAIAVDVRLLSATHRDLEKLVAAGEFREDLYYRLNVVPMSLPAMRERRDDIPLLIEHFLDEFARRRDGERKRFTPEAVAYLVAARWPGNIRQLRNVVEQCVVLSTSNLIPLSLATEALRDEPSDLASLDDARSAFERRYLANILRITQGKVTAAARLAGRNRTEFYKLLQRHKIEPQAFRDKPDLSSDSDA